MAVPGPQHPPCRDDLLETGPVERRGWVETWYWTGGGDGPRRTDTNKNVNTSFQVMPYMQTNDYVTLLVRYSGASNYKQNYASISYSFF